MSAATYLHTHTGRGKIGMMDNSRYHVCDAIMSVIVRKQLRQYHPERVAIARKFEYRPGQDSVAVARESVLILIKTSPSPMSL